MTWGKPYGSDPFITDEGERVYMYRKGQRVRYFDEAGRQHGPEHRNVAPAFVWAYANGWIEATASPGMILGIRKEVGYEPRTEAEASQDS